LPEVPLRSITRIALGIGIMGTLQLLLGLAGGLHRGFAVGLIATGIAMLFVRHRKITAGAIAAWWKTDAGAEWLWLIAAPLLAMAIVAAYAPPGVLWGDEPHGYDVLEYHLQLPREWYELGRIAPLHHNVFSYFPLTVEMHYLLAMQLDGGPWAGIYLAQLMHLAMTALTVFAIYAAAKHAAPKPLAILAALMAASAPWMLLLAPVAYNEGGLLLFGTLAIAWAMTSQHRAGWILAGVFAGFACGAKLTAVPLLLVALPLVAIVTLRTRLAYAGLFVVAAALTFSPWLIRNVAWAKNPVFPEAQAVLGRAHFTQEQAIRWHNANHLPAPSQRTPIARLAAARDQIFIDWRYGYVLFPLALIAAIRTQRHRAAVFAIALLALWLLFWIFFTHLQSRFFVLAIPVAAVLVAMIEGRSARIAVAAVLVLGGVLGYVNVLAKWAAVDLSVSRQTQGVHITDMLGYRDLDRTPDDARDAVAAGQHICLIGDAAVFFYRVPMLQLHYRTVFDVVVNPAQSIIDAWAEGAPPNARRIINRDELDRFARTYYGIPKPD
jgi:hypothetical protein